MPFSSDVLSCGLFTYEARLIKDGRPLPLPGFITFDWVNREFIIVKTNDENLIGSY